MDRHLATASMLTALGISELITRDLDAYRRIWNDFANGKEPQSVRIAAED